MAEPTAVRHEDPTVNGAEPLAAGPEPAAGQEPAVALVESDLLVEDVSIDGMCGVY